MSEAPIPPRPITAAPVRVSGHGLVDEGIPRFLAVDCAARNRDCLDYAERMRTGADACRNERKVPDSYSDGHAKCSCGAVSPHQPSQAARRRWHRQHKLDVIAQVRP